ncbi:MAG TPA: class I SAM-dependent methyltransferase [Dehalococcoidia bacterium]|nr:class I SAM-dependent methyltransferase [Dehalococcoidia bacterium]
MTSDLKSFDRVAHCYDETRGLPPDAERAVAAAIAALAREAAPAPRVLEVGVGTGRIAAPLAAQGIALAGIDISPKMLAVLRQKRHDIDLMLAEAAHPPLRATSFDALLFVHILHLVPDALATLRATLPLLRPGGVVISAGDQGHVALRAQAEDLIRAAAAEIAGIDLTQWDVHERVRALTEQFLREHCADVHTVVLARWATRSRGRAMLERLARKDFSSSWKIPDAALPAVIERVTPQLAALYGGLDAEHEFERAMIATVARLPRA